MRSEHYILEGKTAKAVDMLTWAERFNTANRTVKQTRVGEILVSTVFLGLDHNFFEGGGPLLFETMVFRGGISDECERHSTYEEAENGHASMCDKVFGDSILDLEIVGGL